MATEPIMLCGNHGGRLVLVHIFRGPGREFGFTEDATGANLPSQFFPWTAFKSIDLRRDGEPSAGVDTNDCLGACRKEVRTEVQGCGFIGRHSEFVGVIAW